MALLLAATAAHATTFTVTNSADNGPGSLRQAILGANAMQVTGGTACAAHTIQFAIPGTGPHTIQPLSALPPLQIAITLDGYSQPGASPNTLFQGQNAVLAIELDGTFAGMSNAIVIAPRDASICGGSSSNIKGLAINRFAGAAIFAEGGYCPLTGGCGSALVAISGNFIGTDISGMLARGNRMGLVFGQNTFRNIVGEPVPGFGGSNFVSPASRNVISGNALDGIYMGISNPLATASSDHQIRNNYIGVNATGMAALPNGRNGVFADIASGAIQIWENLISGHPGDGVTIASSVVSSRVQANGIGIGLDQTAIGNLGNGVRVTGTSRATVGGHYPFDTSLQASIANNGGAGVLIEGTGLVDAGGDIANNVGLAIDLAPVGVNPNDDQDGDTGPNQLLNYPVISSALFDPNTGGGTINGTLNSNPNSTVEIFLYLNDACAASGFGGGQRFLTGSFTSVTTDAQGNASFSRQVQNLPPGKFLTALSRRFTTNLNPQALIVSEFSRCTPINSERIFLNGFEP